MRMAIIVICSILLVAQQAEARDTGWEPDPTGRERAADPPQGIRSTGVADDA
jgi:hypothetical protein